MVPLRVPSDISSSDLQNFFISMVSIFGLDGTESTLKQYPGCVHWHLNKPGEKGTLEATWWPKKRKFWLAVHENRRADWQEQVMDHILLMWHTTHEGPQ